MWRGTRKTKASCQQGISQDPPWYSRDLRVNSVTFPFPQAEPLPLPRPFPPPPPLGAEAWMAGSLLHVLCSACDFEVPLAPLIPLAFGRVDGPGGDGDL